MHKITDEQVDFILNDIKANGVHIEDLQYNLLDHICCIIENEMPENEDFYKFYENILPRFFKNELKEIQEETEFLLNFKHYYAMKNTLKISGIIAIAAFLLGGFFKTLHLPGAGILIILGGFIFSLIFLPLMIVLKFKDEEKAVDKWVFSLGFILAIMASLGVVFKIMHWPYANFLMRYGNVFFIFGFVPLYYITRIKRVDERLNTTVNAVLMMACGAMLYALTNIGGSKSYKDSIYSSYEFMNNNSQRVYEANLKIKNKNDDLKNADFHKISDDLYNHITETKAYLISVVNQTSIEIARKTEINQLSNPNAYLSIKPFFEDGNGQYSIAVLKQKVEKYNQLIRENYPENSEKIIVFDELQLEKTVLSMVLFELSQLQLQLVQNENSLLNYHFSN